jgi:DNA-binding NarL/FixJ family response regulator
MHTQRTREQGTEPLRVLVVDDSELFRTGLHALLLSEGFEVATAASGAAALRQVGDFRPDVVVMDMAMPDMSGNEATRRIVEAAPDTFVMVLTGSEGADVLDAIRAGASGYQLKGAELSDIVKAIRATAAGHSPFAAQIAGPLLAMVRETPVADGPAVGAMLSGRERQVLTLLVHGCNNA